MGYTTGRRHTDESLIQICQQYHTRSELQLSDPSVYRTCLLRGHDFLNRACSHMIVNHSTPQLICKLIFEKLLKTNCLYNDRKTIAPYELDIYFPNLRFAVEYNGRGWHNKREVKERDLKKQKLCEGKGIKLLVLEEGHRKYEEDIKQQLVCQLDFINKACNLNIAEQDVRAVDCSQVFDYIIQLKDPDVLRGKINTCKNISEFQKKFPHEYKIIMQSNLGYLLESIRQKHFLSDDDIKKECAKFSSIRDLFRQNPRLYHRCHKRGLMDEACAHMTNPKRGEFFKLTTEELISQIKKMQPLHKTDVLRRNAGLYREARKRNINWGLCWEQI